MDGIIVHVRSTKGCLLCMISAWDAKVQKLSSVMVSDRDGGLPSVGEGQSSIYLKKY